MYLATYRISSALVINKAHGSPKELLSLSNSTSVLRYAS